jgi:hypothetical protein
VPAKSSRSTLGDCSHLGRQTESETVPLTPESFSCAIGSAGTEISDVSPVTLFATEKFLPDSAAIRVLDGGPSASLASAYAQGNLHSIDVSCQEIDVRMVGLRNSALRPRRLWFLSAVKMSAVLIERWKLVGDSEHHFPKILSFQ